MPRLLPFFVFFVLISPVHSPSALAQIPTDGLVAYYPFNGNANDESGNGNHGTIYGPALAEDRFGNPNSAYDFDGVDDYIDFGTDASTLLKQSMSISLWMKLSGFPIGGVGLIQRHGYGDSEPTNVPFAANLLNSNGATRWWAVHEWGSGNDASSFSVAEVDADVLYHVGIVRDHLLQTYTFYINGKLDSEGSYGVNATGGEDTRGYIGTSNSLTPVFNGILDDIRLYDRVLSFEEILELYNEDPLAPYGVTYGSTGSANATNPGALISIDPLTGVGTLIGPTGIIGDGGPAVRALAIKSTGEMYAMSHTASSDLYSVNASTGAGTFVANTGLLRPGDICFDAEDVLYAVDDTNILYTIDETTGVRTVIGATGVALAGLAYDPTDGTMYGSGSADDIYTIDLETGAVTLVGTTGLGGNTPDIHFDQAGNLFGVKRGAGGVYDYIAIDKTTGAGTLIGSTGFVAVVGLATRLVPPSAIPCVDVANFQTRCQGGGTIQARLTLANTNYTGEIVEFSIDGSPYQVTVGSSGRANLSVGVFDLGLHTVEVTIPAGCVDPVTVRCRSGVAMEGDELWNDEEVLEIPTATALLGNYPNPFNPSTTLRYGLSEPGHVTLRVYNALGQLVRTIVDEHQVQGIHEVTWDGRNESGAAVASGIYVYRMTAGDFLETKRMVLMK